MLEIKIDSNTNVPLYHQITEQVKYLIISNQLKPGEQIPSVRDLATWLQLNPSTVAKAYYCLKQEGLVVTSRRHGTVIRGRNNQPSLNDKPFRIFEDYTLQNIAVTFTLQPIFWHIQRSE